MDAVPGKKLAKQQCTEPNCWAKLFLEDFLAFLPTFLHYQII